MKKRRLSGHMDELTLLLWGITKVGAVILFRLLLVALNFAALILFFLWDGMKSQAPGKKERRFREKQSAHMAEIAELLLPLTYLGEAIDQKMRESAPARRFFAVSAIFLGILLLNPPEYWGRWHLYQTGTASYYGKGFHMRRTASGEWFLPFGGLTAAHRDLPIGSEVLVKNIGNGRKVVVKINDRGPFVPGRMIDLSASAAKKLEMKKDGLAEVQIFTRKKALLEGAP